MLTLYQCAVHFNSSRKQMLFLVTGCDVCLEMLAYLNTGFFVFTIVDVLLFRFVLKAESKTAKSEELFLYWQGIQF